MSLIPIDFSRPSLSFGIERMISETLSGHSTVTADLIASAVLRGFSEIYPSAEVKRQLDTLVAEVIDRITKVGKPETGSSRYVSKSLGTGYAQWVTELNAEEACLLVAGFDPRRASDLYWRTPIAVAERALNLFIEAQHQSMLINYEAVMYGMGGKYSGDTGGTATNVYDLQTAEGQAALKALGF